MSDAPPVLHRPGLHARHLAPPLLYWPTGHAGVGGALGAGVGDALGAGVGAPLGTLVGAAVGTRVIFRFGAVVCTVRAKAPFRMIGSGACVGSAHAAVVVDTAKIFPARWASACSKSLCESSKDLRNGSCLAACVVECNAACITADALGFCARRSC